LLVLFADTRMSAFRLNPRLPYVVLLTRHAGSA
jgi:hypothetical protein